MAQVHVMNHPLIVHKLSLMRDKYTGAKEFREAVEEMSSLLCYEATRDLPMKEVEIETPIAQSKVKVISGKKIALVAILRSGMEMAHGALDLIPNAKIGHIGMYRDPDTMQPVEYYCKLPTDIAHSEVFVLDPMLATGGTAIALGVVKLMALHDVYASCDPQNAALYLVLSIFFRFLKPVFLFVSRNLERGMPPRKTPPRQDPAPDSAPETN